MKKLFLSIAIALGVLTVSAQEAGSMWVGGSVGFQYADEGGGSSNTSYKILPEFGYILSENLAVGANLGYAHIEGSGSLQNIEFNGGKADGFIIAPFVRYTFLKGSMGALFMDTGVDYAHLKGSGIKATSIEAGFKPGLAFILSEKVSLIGKFGFLGYSHTELGYNHIEYEKKADAFGFNLDLSNIQIGAVVHF